jgi:DNA topoisomerase I
LPLPRFGSVVVTDKSCEKHGMSHIRIINKGKRPWDLGCPHCNFLEWQAKKAQELADPARAAEAEAKAKKKTKPAARSAKRTKTASPAKGDGLVKLPGVGPKTLEKLSAAGIMTSQDLLGAKTKALSSKTGLSEKKILAWKSAAKALS